MDRKELTENEKLKLRNKAKNEYIRLQTIQSDPEMTEMVGAFRSKFTTCEIVYKIILEQHQLTKKGKCPANMTINMGQVPHALEFAGYDFDRELLTKVFGSEKKAGIRSVKKIRDMLTHSMSKGALNELQQRHDELNGYMDAFLSTINTFDEDSD